jgi:hypothetical protein
MEADGSWWCPWSSKPAWGVKSVPGVFDSHTPPPCARNRRVAFWRLLLELEGDRMRVRYTTMAAVAVVASLALSGCSVKSSIDAQLAPKPTTVTVEATIATVGAPIDGTLAEGFPSTVPMWPAGKVVKSKTTKTPQGKSYSVVLTTSDPFADVVAGVGEGLKQSKWKVAATDATTPDQKVSILLISNTEADGIVTISQLPKKPVRIEYVITPKN